LGGLILDDVVLDVIRRELRRLSPDIKIDKEELRSVLEQEVLKREVTEGDKAEEARKKIAKAQVKALRVRVKAATATDVASENTAVVIGEDAGS
jgi:hypothetical protein